MNEQLITIILGSLFTLIFFSGVCIGWLIGSNKRLKLIRESRQDIEHLTVLFKQQKRTIETLIAKNEKLSQRVGELESETEDIMPKV